MRSTRYPMAELRTALRCRSVRASNIYGQQAWKQLEKCTDLNTRVRTCALRWKEKHKSETDSSCSVPIYLRMKRRGLVCPM